MPPFALRHLDHVVLRVVDLASSIAFYTGVLGCTIEKRRDELGLVHLRAGASLIDLVSVDGKLGAAGGAAAGSEARNVDHVCLGVAPFDEAGIVSHLRRHGVEPHGAAVMNFGAEGTGPSLYLSDPDGNTIELKGPPAPAPEPRDASAGARQSAAGADHRGNLPGDSA